MLVNVFSETGVDGALPNDPVGWDTQLDNERTLQLSYDRQWRMIHLGGGFTVAVM